MLGALLFLIYIIPLEQLIRSYGLNNHGYADDTQLCLSFKKTSDNAIVKREIPNLEKCLCGISVWMSQNRPSRNVSKHTFPGSPIEALLTMTQIMIMCSAFEHFRNGNGAI